MVGMASLGLVDGDAHLENSVSLTAECFITNYPLIADRTRVMLMVNVEIMARYNKLVDRMNVMLRDDSTFRAGD